MTRAWRNHTLWLNPTKSLVFADSLDLIVNIFLKSAEKILYKEKYYCKYYKYRCFQIEK